MKYVLQSSGCDMCGVCCELARTIVVWKNNIHTLRNCYTNVATNSGVLQYLKGCVYVWLGTNLCFIWHLPDHYQVYNVFSYIRNTVWSWAVSINFIWNMPLAWNPAAKWFSMLHSSIKFHKASTIRLPGFQRLTVSKGRAERIHLIGYCDLSVHKFGCYLRSEKGMYSVLHAKQKWIQNFDY